MAHDISRFPIHLGLGATAVSEPEFSGLAWYADYVERHANDGAQGRIVGMYDFTENWDSWEVHPHGDEVVLCTAGAMTLHQEFPDGSTREVTISAGEYAINPAGVWHTADVSGTATAVFITAGLGTQHRQR